MIEHAEGGYRSGQPVNQSRDEAILTVALQALLFEPLNVVDQLDAIDMSDSDTKGDLYEYMLGKIASAVARRTFWRRSFATAWWAP